MYIQIPCYIYICNFLHPIVDVEGPTREGHPLMLVSIDILQPDAVPVPKRIIREYVTGDDGVYGDALIKSQSKSQRYRRVSPLKA